MNKKYSTYGEIHKNNFIWVWNTKPHCSPHTLWWFSCLLHYYPDFFSTCKETGYSTLHPKWGMHSWHLLAEGEGGVLAIKPDRQWGQGRLCCCINRSQFSYGLTWLALIPADWADSNTGWESSAVSTCRWVCTCSYRIYMALGFI